MHDFPPISALFLIYFDIKAGYTIAWKRSLPGIELQGAVEYKSLPSGLHTVAQDLIYFVHNNHAGLSAFLNSPAGEESRNARMISVGVLLPLSYGRMGRSWKYAKHLKELASKLTKDKTKTEILQSFWEEHKVHEMHSVEDSDGALDSPIGSPTVEYQAIQNASKKPGGHDSTASNSATLLPPGDHLSEYHPAWSLPHLLETFGPLIFPIHRAALLRKRILITTHAPIEESCNFVYDISLLANLPRAITELLGASAPSKRLQPLFSIGVHDIPLLESDLQVSEAAATTPVVEEIDNGDALNRGWIACTTDSILAMKSALYDVLITLPPIYSNSATKNVWPKIESPSGTEIRATQRDLRRYQTLKRGLSYHNSLPSTISHTFLRGDHLVDISDMDNIVETTSWPALAYAGFMWWASAGEQGLTSEEESDADAQLLSGLMVSPLTPQRPETPLQSSVSQRREGLAEQETAIITYFHRLTTQILTTLGDINVQADLDNEREDSELLESEDSRSTVDVSSSDVERMGLDMWSANDRQFVQDIAQKYFGLEAQVENQTIDICGIRVC